MDLWVNHAKRRRACTNCTHEILPGNQVMIMQWKKTGMYQGKIGTRTRLLMSHLSCWISKAYTYLEDHPYEPPNTPGPGRPIKYTPDQLRRRRNLQMQIRRWRGQQEDYNGQGMWAMADKYKDKVREARERLGCM